MKYNNAEERAWAAGFFDGEGNSYIHKVKNRRYVMLTVGQIELTILERFRTAVNCGQIYGPYKRGEYHWKPHWMWKATNRTDVLKALRALWPWLHYTKREQARASLQARTSSVRSYGPRIKEK